MKFFRQEYWSGLPSLLQGIFPSLGIEPRYPALQTDSLPSEPPGKSCKVTMKSCHLQIKKQVFTRHQVSLNLDLGFTASKMMRNKVLLFISYWYFITGVHMLICILLIFHLIRFLFASSTGESRVKVQKKKIKSVHLHHKMKFYEKSSFCLPCETHSIFLSYTLTQQSGLRKDAILTASQIL